MPSYNSDQFIEQSIKSVIGQSYTNWELLVCDDGSTDSTMQIVKSLMVHEPRIKILQNKFAKGAAGARNSCIEIAVGRFIAFLDSDDLWHSEKLEKQISFMNSNNYSFSHTWYSVFQQSGDKKYLLDNVRWEEKYSYKQILRSGRIGCLTVMYDVRKLGKCYMPNINKRQDLALWLNILKSTEYIWCLQEDLAKYRKVPGSISSDKCSLIKYHWLIFRNLQNLGRLRSVYYLITYLTYFFLRKLPKLMKVLIPKKSF